MSDLITATPDLGANDFVIAREMAEALHQAYPGHLWAVSCSGETGMADVRNLMLSGSWGFRLKLKDIYSGSAFKKDVIKAGGELLERYRVARGRFNAENMASMPVDFAGRLKADHG